MQSHMEGMDEEIHNSTGLGNKKCETGKKMCGTTVRL
jgi:hypothetical protein